MFSLSIAPTCDKNVSQLFELHSHSNKKRNRLRNKFGTKSNKCFPTAEFCKCSSGATRTCHILDSCEEIGHRTYVDGMAFEWIERHK